MSGEGSGLVTRATVLGLVLVAALSVFGLGVGYAATQPSGSGDVLNAIGVTDANESIDTAETVTQSTAEGTTVYVGSHDSNLYAVDAQTGNKNWSFTEPSGKVGSSPTVVDGTVYVSDGSKLYAVDSQTGDETWNFKEGGSSPTVVDGTVYVGSRGSGNLSAVDADTGDEIWNFSEPSDAVASSPTVVDGTVYVGSHDSNLYAVNAQTGNEEWRFTKPDGIIRSSPTVSDGSVYVGSHDKTVYAVDTTTGEQKWEFTQPDGGITSSPTVFEGVLYIGSGNKKDTDGTLYAIDTGSGQKIWDFEANEPRMQSSPTVSDGVVYVGTGQSSDTIPMTGGVYAIYTENGSKKWFYETSQTVSRSSPTVHNDNVYFGSQANELISVDADTGDEVWTFSVPCCLSGVHSSPTVVTNPENGDSVGSRVLQGTLGHHNVFAENGPTQPGDGGGGTEPANFKVSIDNTNSPVTEGDTLTVDATITNTGDQSDTQTVTARAPGLGSDSKTVELGGVSSTTETFSIPTGSGDNGDYTLTVSSDDDSASEDVNVGTAGSANFEVSIDNTNSPVTEGSILEIDATIENTGGQFDSQTITARAPGLGSDSKTVDLSGGSSTTETFSISTGSGDKGDYTLTVSSDDDSDSATVSVEEEEDDIDVKVDYTRKNTTVKSPVTVQVTEPTGDEYKYHWQVSDAPDGSNPELLHGKNYERSDNTEDKPHAALRPDESGNYTLKVGVSDGEGTVATDTIEIEAEKDYLDDYVDFSIDGTASELAETYAPVYHFHENEDYYPTRYEAYVENSELRDGNGNTLEEKPSLLELGNPGLIDEPYTPRDSSNKLFMMGDQSGFQRYQEQYPQTIYTSVTNATFDSEDYIALQYWTFYLFDPKGDRDGWVRLDDLGAWASAHNADIESTTILINKSGPQWILASQHLSGEYLRWEEVAGGSEVDNIDVYPASGSHSSFLVNTQRDEYNSDIPGQKRWTDNSLTSTSLHRGPIPLENIEDVTGSDTIWSYSEGDYDLAMLSDEEGWADFGGDFDSGEHPRAINPIAQQTGYRWDDIGTWATDVRIMLSEIDVLKAQPVDTKTKFERDDNGCLSHYDIGREIRSAASPSYVTKWKNPGVKPHTFYAEATISGDSSGTRSFGPITVPLGWDEQKMIKVGIDQTALDPDESVTVRDARILAHPPEIARSNDLIWSQSDEKTAEACVDSLLNFGGLSTTGTATESTDVVSPGDTVQRSMTVGNPGSEAGTFFVEFTASGPNGETYGDISETGKTVSLEPGETKTVSLSWTVEEDVPEGTYDIVTRGWLESNPDELLNQLDSRTETDAFTVTKPEGELSVTTTPENATIIADGEVVGEAPLTTDLPIGTYEIAAIHEENLPVNETVEIEEGETKQLSLDLTQHFDVSIDSTNSPVTEGETLTVTATVENTRNQPGTQTIEANLSGVGSVSETVSLNGSESRTETFSIPPNLIGPGTYTLTVESGNDTATETVTVDTAGGGGSLDPSNPFADSSGNPVSRGTVTDRVVQWNLNSEIDGTSFTRKEIINFVVQWNTAN